MGLGAVVVNHAGKARVYQAKMWWWDRNRGGHGWRWGAGEELEVKSTQHGVGRVREAVLP